MKIQTKLKENKFVCFSFFSVCRYKPFKKKNNTQVWEGTE